MQREDFNFYTVAKELPYSDGGFLDGATMRTMQIIAQRQKKRRKLTIRWCTSVAAAVIVTFGVIFYPKSEEEVYQMSFEETISSMTDAELNEYLFYAENDLVYYDEI